MCWRGCPLNLNAAGINVGHAEHTVAVPPGRNEFGQNDTPILFSASR
jgi:hypothetical protein